MMQQLRPQRSCPAFALCTMSHLRAAGHIDSCTSLQHARAVSGAVAPLDGLSPLMCFRRADRTASFRLTCNRLNSATGNFHRNVRDFQMDQRNSKERFD